MKKMMILLVLISIPIANCLAQEYTWAARGGGDINFGSNPNTINEYEHIRDIVVDSQNNYYYLATVSSNNTNLNGIPFTNYNRPNFGNDIFLFSTDCNGSVRWQKTIGGHNDDLTQHLSIDSNDNIYVSGYVLGRGSSNDNFIHFDTDVIINSNLTLTTPGPHNKNLFLIKYDSAGVFQWLQRPQKDATSIQDIQKSYTFGHYTDANNVTHWLMTMGAGTHINGVYTTNTDNYAIFRFDDQGTYLGQTPVDLQFTNGRATYASVVTMDEILNRYYISVHKTTVGSQTISFLGSNVIGYTALAAVDASNGNQIWRIENTGGEQGTSIVDIAVDGQSNIYITGEGNTAVDSGFPAPDTLAGHTFTQTNASGTAGGYAPFLIKINSQGSLLWGSNPVIGTEASSHSVTINGNEVAIATGMQVPSNWGSQTFNRPSSWLADPVVVRFDTTTGNVLGIEDVLGPAGQQDEATAIATDNFGNYVVGGYMRSTLFQNNTGITPLQINGSGETDFWYARLATTDCAGVPLSIEEESVNQVSIFPNPATDFVEITGDLSFTSYSIYNISGQQVLSGSIDGDNRIDVLFLTSGVYFIELQGDSGVSQALKLIKL
ncbi:T9SS type A sorting domain-containing protein [Nonlabens sp. Ci31]|uniref:T9SS type A sorting domain-containing protein n=1 Tax=Nonlabens sp. Ci31 TaxID=2608253 RepID=UPI001462A368|nr:T9SS type A sorting domain-containing protein [Nonlabens sp. Ci31]QJP34131.1 T9SS type A sorting domain-containing protein [Nonlabens sp. Ci31]